MQATWLLGLIFPVAFAAHVLKTDRYVCKPLVTLSCILLCIGAQMTTDRPAQGLPFLIGAFALSIVGDWFLSHKERRSSHYLFGILAFFSAHALYLGYALARPFSTATALVLLLVLAAALLVYFLRRISPNVKDSAMKTALFGYVLISCVTFSFSAASTMPLLAHLPFAAGIGLILYSDICIGETDFAGNARMKGQILPTYYLAHMLITASVILGG